MYNKEQEETYKTIIGSLDLVEGVIDDIESSPSLVKDNQNEFDEIYGFVNKVVIALENIIENYIELLDLNKDSEQIKGIIQDNVILIIICFDTINHIVKDKLR